MDEQFIELCKIGDLDTVIKFYENNKNNIHNYYDKAFRVCCYYGNLNIAQWLYSLGGVDIYVINDAPFRLSCTNGHLNIAQWLYSLGDINIHANIDHAFRISCDYGKLNVVKWLLSIDIFDCAIVDSKLPEQLYEHAFSLGYLPVNNSNMKTAYIEYKNKIKNKIKEHKENGPISIFEIECLVNIIILYV